MNPLEFLSAAWPYLLSLGTGVAWLWARVESRRKNAYDELYQLCEKLQKDSESAEERWRIEMERREAGMRLEFTQREERMQQEIGSLKQEITTMSMLRLEEVQKRVAAETENSYLRSRLQKYEPKEE